MTARVRYWLGLSLAVVLSACAASGGTASDVSLVREVPPGFVPVAPWTGRLVLPAADERRPEGAVRIEVHNAPDASLIGRQVWLRFEGGMTWPRLVLRDVAFDEAARASAARGNVHPTRLDGWRQVSPLESLAGARPEDDVEVALEGARLEGGDLVIGREPVQIPGDYVALVRVGGPVAGGAPGEREVRLWSESTGDFTGRVERVIFDAPAVPSGGASPAPADGASPMPSPVDGIEVSPLQAAGFYIHGRLGDDGRFHVAALEPRQTRQLGPDGVSAGGAAATAFATDEVWRDVPGRKGSARSVLLAPAADEAGARAWAAAALTEGAELLVVHLSGAAGPYDEGARRAGHFAFGLGRVARDVITGELQLEVRYRQLVAQNAEGVVAGTHSYANYEGNFRGGGLYLRPASDVALLVPALARDYDLGGVTFRPLDGLARELEAMAARYRTGNGTGGATVAPVNACVQDASQALLVALMKAGDQVRTSPAGARALAERPDDPQAVDFRALDGLAAQIEQFLRPVGVTREGWQRQANKVAAVTGCAGGAAGEGACELDAYRTIFPRDAHALYVRALLGLGAGGVAASTYQAGGAMSGLVPLAPTSPTRPL